MTSIVNLMARQEQIEYEIRNLRMLLEATPEETIFSRQRKDGKYKYYKRECTTDGTVKEVYLGQKDLPRIKEIAKRMLAKKKLEDLIYEKKLCEKLIAFKKNESAADAFLRHHQGIGALLQGERNQMDQCDMEWKRLPYIKNRNYPEALKYTTVVPGLLTRSKAEADLVARFEHYGVPYHYDEILTFGSDSLAMDFVCRNVRTKKILYWDHRGMSDSPEYINKILYCENILLNAGIIQGINLIVTSETRDMPLDLQWVDMLIQHYLL